MKKMKRNGCRAGCSEAIIARAVWTMAAMGLLVAACEESNPLVGKWKAAPGGANQGECEMLGLEGPGTVEFTEKLLINHVMGSGPVRYSRDSARYVATTGEGRPFVFEKTDGGLTMISPFFCKVVKADTSPLPGKSNPLLGKWIPVKGDSDCRSLVSLEFTEKTMTRNDERGRLVEPVTYSHDGARYVAGGTLFLEQTPDGLKMTGSLECRLVKAGP